MWLLVLFDLPTTSKKERKEAAGFRKELIADGFIMLQYSVYIRHCDSMENVHVHEKRVEQLLPDTGMVSMIHFTDKQLAGMRTFYGKNNRPLPDGPEQLEIF